jgi:hypothetical protein
MINAERIVRELDARLDHEVRMVLYGRAALALGFANAPAAANDSLDVDAIIPMSAREAFQADEQFWTAQQLTEAFQQMQPIQFVELEDAFKRARPLILAMACD